jgi:hypothetical protein
MVAGKQLILDRNVLLAGNQIMFARKFSGLFQQDIYAVVHLENS